MSESTVAIVGSGVAGVAIAEYLTRRGIDVAIFEKGKSTPYPPVQQYIESVRFLHGDNPWRLPEDLDHVVSTGRYHSRLADERDLRLGGCCMRWAGITLRIIPQEFKLRTVYGYGDDWPISYEELEPYYCEAEAFLGVSGTDSDNPFAPPRSRPYPLPPFELSYDDMILGERLKKNGMVLHTTPQARTREPYDGRSACDNYGSCGLCPVGARYFPIFHLNKATATGLCTVHTDTSVRRIVVDKTGAGGIVYQRNGDGSEAEHAAKIVILAAGTFETPRLLLLSKQSGHPDGIGNSGGQVGKNLTFHHFWGGLLQYEDERITGRFGGWTGQSHQFLDPDDRGRHGGLKVEFSSNTGWVGLVAQEKWSSGKEVREALRSRLRMRPIGMHCEAICSEEKFLDLSSEVDRFGDPFARVNYKLNDFDHETHRFARKVYDRFRDGTGAEGGFFPRFEAFSTAWHHMGTCRMGASAANSVVDSNCQVHGIKNLYAVGECSIVGSGGAVNPTLTVAALAIRAAHHIEQSIRG